MSKQFKSVITRLLSQFITSAVATTGVSSLIAPELEVWKSAVIAGGTAVLSVVAKLAQSMKDGELTEVEIEEAFVEEAPAKLVAKEPAKKAPAKKAPSK